MADLLTRLIRANDIIVRAYSYSDECSRLQRQANVTYDKKSKQLTMITAITICALFIAGGFAALILISVARQIFHSEKLLELIFTIPFFASCACALCGYLFIARPIVSKKEKKDKEEFDNAMTHALAVYQTGADLIRDNAEYVWFLSQEYFYPLATGYLVQCVQQRRASTLQEALDKYDEQLHRWKMESNQQQILQQQRIQAQQLNAIKDSVNCNTAVTVAGFAASFLSRL